MPDIDIIPYHHVYIDSHPYHNVQDFRCKFPEALSLLHTHIHSRVVGQITVTLTTESFYTICHTFNSLTLINNAALPSAFISLSVLPGQHNNHSIVASQEEMKQSVRRSNQKKNKIKRWELLNKRANYILIWHKDINI